MAVRTMKQGDWLTVPEAIERILATIEPVGTEIVPFPDLLGRTLAEPIHSPIDHPPWDNSAMDGYAVRAIDIQGAGPDFPIPLRVVDDIPAGSFPSYPIGPGEAARIMTGAPVPVGADTVVRVEHTAPVAGDGDTAAPAEVEILSYSDTLRNIRLRGEDIEAGAIVLEAGHPIRAAEVGLLALIGCREAVVRRRPRVALLATGDELVGPDDFAEVLAGRRIMDSNTPMLAAALIRAGCEPIPLGIATDDRENLRRHLAAARGADALITTAGASVGEFDLVREALGDLGYNLDFWRVRMRPGSPFSFGVLDGMPVFGVAGNPVSALVTFEVLLRPALRRLLGRNELYTPMLSAQVAERIPGAGELMHFVRVRLAPDGAGGWHAELTGPQGSGILSSLSRADGLLIVPAGEATLEPGATARVLPLDPGERACDTPGWPAGD